MTGKIIDRASKKIDKDDFVRLLKLHQDKEWLKHEPNALFDLWCLTENNDQKNLIEFLINNFFYIDSHELTRGSKIIAEKIENEWNLSPTNTFLIATCDNSRPDGSQVLIQNLKNKFSIKWKEYNFFNSIVDGANNIKMNSNFILVDDFIGTGKTITNKINYIKKKVDEKNIEGVTLKIVSLASMSFSKEDLDKLNVEYYSVHWLNKGISELVPKEILNVSINSMEELENKLKKKYNGRKIPNFGYQRSESLYALESYNIPNNVFPIFWWPYLKGGILRKTFFKRV